MSWRAATIRPAVDWRKPFAARLAVSHAHGCASRTPGRATEDERQQHRCEQTVRKAGAGKSHGHILRDHEPECEQRPHRRYPRRIPPPLPERPEREYPDHDQRGAQEGREHLSVGDHRQIGRPAQGTFTMSSYKGLGAANEFGTLFIALGGLMNLILAMDCARREPAERPDR